MATLTTFAQEDIITLTKLYITETIAPVSQCGETLYAHGLYGIPVT